MIKYADLEIGLRWQKDHDYEVELRYKPARSAVDVQSGVGSANIDPHALGVQNPPEIYPAKYGRALTESLFADPKVRSGFDKARASAKAIEAPLRIRLLIHDGAEELHQARWETLCDPGDNSLLCEDPNIYLSRFSLTSDYRPVHLGPKSQLRALVMVANPSNLDPKKMAPVDVQKETKVAMESLGPIYSESVSNSDSGQYATLKNLIMHLSASKYDIVYLVCHGKTNDQGESFLLLENDKGELDIVAGKSLETEFNRLLDKRPNLVVLASCQSAGQDERSAMTSLGPRLAQAGVPAVIAMQGKITMKTTADFMSVFFQEMQKHGVVDRAMAEARYNVREEPDFWMPVLFMRLRKGGIWSGFSDSAAFDKWPVLTRAIEMKKLIPILGAGLVEPIIGSLREIAAVWAEEFEYPMFDHDRDSLPQIAQFVADKYGADFPKTDLAQRLIDKLQKERKNELAANSLKDTVSLDDIICALAANRRKRAPWDAYKVLAKLDLPIYITANLSRVMESALEEEGKKPHTLISPWNKYIVDLMIDEDHKSGQKSINANSPLVFHPFGRLNDPNTVVLTEDEYFQYLIGATENRTVLPAMLQKEMVSGTLLFLGFHLVDWDLRVLLQTLFSFEGSALLKRKKHVAVIQIDLEGLKSLEGARKYLQERLQNWSIYMYLGSAEDFVNELLFHLPAEKGGRQR